MRQLKLITRLLLGKFPIGLFNLFYKILGVKKVIILVYHHVAELDDELQPFIKNSHNVTPDEFRKQISFLKQKNINLVNLNDLNHNNIPPGISVAITFDDGMKSVIDNAHPILMQNNINYSMFVTSCLLDQKLFWRDVVYHAINTKNEESYLKPVEDELSEEQLNLLRKNLRNYSKHPDIFNYKLFKKLNQSYIESNNLDEQAIADQLYLKEDDLMAIKDSKNIIGNHTLSHPPMQTLNKEETRKEFISCHESLDSKKLLSQELKCFALPFGIPKYNYAHLEEVFKQHGYNIFLYVSPKANHFTQSSHRYDRLLAPTTQDQFQFELIKSLIRS